VSPSTAGGPCDPRAREGDDFAGFPGIRGATDAPDRQPFADVPGHGADLKTSHVLTYEVGMRKSSAVIVLAGLAALAGCGPSAQQEALIRKESAPYRHRGTATIAGRAFLVTPDGRQIPGAAEEVYLTPVTTWAASRFSEVISSNEIPDAADRAAQVWWTERADASGRFAFAQLPAGEYYVLSPIAYAAGGDAKELIAYARVRIGSGEKAEVEVTRRIEIK
jgi:hypothetical protein